MNKLALIHKSKCFLITCKLLTVFGSIDVVKLCLMLSAFLQINKKSFNSISDFFQLFADSLSCDCDELVQIVDNIEFLKLNNIIKIDENRVSLVTNTNVSSFDLLPKEAELLELINDMKIDSLLRYIAQYV